jgi:ankyrin repeat protein
MLVKPGVKCLHASVLPSRAAHLQETCIIIGCLATLYLARMFWDMARVSLPMWHRGTTVGALNSLLIAVELMVEGFLRVVRSVVTQCMIFVLLLLASRIPLWICIWFSGTNRRTKRLFVSASIPFSAQLLGCYYLGGDNLFARGFAVGRPVYDASAANSTWRLGGALARGAAVDEAGWPYYYTALHEASRKGHTEVVRMLLAHGADPGRANAFGDTALSVSSCNGHSAVVRLLIAHGADPNTRNAFGDTPLMLASYHGHQHLVNTLLSAGASADAVNIYSDSALSLAVRRRHVEVVRRLQYSMSWRQLSTILKDAAANVVKGVLKPFQVVATPMQRVLWPLMQRVPRLSRTLNAVLQTRKQDPDDARTGLVYRLYLDGGDLEGPCSAFQSKSLLHLFGYTDVICQDAACERCAATVPYLHRLVLTWGLWFWQQFDGDFRSLLDSRVKSDKAGLCREAVLALCWFCLAAYGCVCDMFDLLASLRAKGARERALYLAAKNMEVEEVRDLLELGVCPEGYRDAREYGANALISACIQGHEQVVRDLLEARANPDVTDHFGRTPIMHAALHAHPEIVRMLLEAGSDLDVQDIFLNTALMACFSRFFVGFAWDVDFAGRNRQVARLLIERGADIHKKDQFGATALEWCWLNTQLEMLLNLALPHHLYHIFMYDMLLQHTFALQAVAGIHLCATAAA